MIKNIDRIPLSSIELAEDPLSPLKAHIKILKKKLPEDFFIGRNGMYSSTSVVRNSQRNPPTTSNHPRKAVKQD